MTAIITIFLNIYSQSFLPEQVEEEKDETGCGKPSLIGGVGGDNNALTGCWSAEPHDRPSFRDVLALLDEISRSEFVTTTHESFREIQEDWHREIEEMFNELRTKEKVISHLLSSTYNRCLLF